MVGALLRYQPIDERSETMATPKYRYEAEGSPRPLVLQPVAGRMHINDDGEMCLQVKGLYNHWVTVAWASPDGGVNLGFHTILTAIN